MKNRHFRVKSAEEAWNKANEIFPTDYAKDEGSSQRAGYPIFRSTSDGHFYDYICDLNDRLEVNLSTGETVNIWIEQETEPEVAPEKMEALKKISTRIQKLGFWFAGAMLDDEEKGEENRRNFEKAKAENPDTLVFAVDCSENNVRVMKDCLKSCQRAYKYIQKNQEEIEEWQMAGINAMFDQVNKEGIVPFDLPYAIEGILLILDQEVNK